MHASLSRFWLAYLLTGLVASAWAAQPEMPTVREPEFPDRRVRVTDFGAVGDGKTLNTEAFAKAIASLAKQGGGQLVIPPGIWLTGPIRLQSNLDLHLEAGALLQFSSDYKLFPLVVLDVKGEKEIDSVSPISGENLENVAITGHGIIDGAGDAWRPVKKGKLTESQWRDLAKSGVIDGSTWYPSRAAMEGGELVQQLVKDGSLKLEDYEPAHHFLRPKMVKLINCRRVLFEGVTFQNAPNWTLNPALCTDVVLRDVTVRNPWYGQNTDALDLESCRNAIVRGCAFDVGDDGICLKSGKDAAGRRIGVPTENVWIEDCVVYHAHGGFTIGSEMSGDVRNVHVNNCTFIGTDIGLRFKSTRGRGGVVEKIYIQNVRMTDIPAEAISFNMYYGGKAPLDAKGELADIERKAMPVSEETPQFRDIYIEDVICCGARGAMLLQGLPEMPIRGIHLQNVSITAERGMVWMDAENISLKNVEILNRQGPVLTVFNAKSSTVDHLTYPPTAETVLKVLGPTSSGIIFTNTDLKAGKVP
jgi:polygalacturonase